MPDFFARVPSIEVRDPLAEFLGSAEGGFKGIAGRFERRGLLRFGAAIAADLRFTRRDTGASAEIDLRHPAVLSPDLRAALRRALSPDASAAERETFARAWQARAAVILLE